MSSDSLYVDTDTQGFEGNLLGFMNVVRKLSYVFIWFAI